MILQDVFSQYDVKNNRRLCKWYCGIIFLGVEGKTNKLIGYDASDIDKEKSIFIIN